MKNHGMSCVLREDMATGNWQLAIGDGKLWQGAMTKES